jgi:hypothetical protein
MFLWFILIDYFSIKEKKTIKKTFHSRFFFILRVSLPQQPFNDQYYNQTKNVNTFFAFNCTSFIIHSEFRIQMYILPVLKFSQFGTRFAIRYSSTVGSYFTKKIDFIKVLLYKISQCHSVRYVDVDPREFDFLIFSTSLFHAFNLGSTCTAYVCKL